MMVPRFWASARGSTNTPDGQTLALKAWGWSIRSQEEAGAEASRRLDDLLQRVRSGGAPPESYLYGGDRPIREEVVEEIHGPEGTPSSLVTRNRYGSLVLNTARVPFIDVDLPSGRGAGGGAGPLTRLARLFRRAPSDESVLLDRLRQAATGESLVSLRIYRTAGGFRVLLTDILLDPRHEATDRMMGLFGADPCFVKLCRAQRSFRARLTPKPWRCGCPSAPGAHPRETPEDQASFAAWLDAYDAAALRWATCRFLEAPGPGVVLPEVRPVVDYHDRMTRASEDVPLA